MRNACFAFSFLMGYVGRAAYISPNPLDSLQLGLMATVFALASFVCLLLSETEVRWVRE